MRLPLEKIAEKINFSLSVEVAYYFGSFAEGKENRESDLDIAVLCKRGSVPSTEKVWELRLELADLCGRDVDILILNDAGLVIAMQVISKGKVFIENTQKAHEMYAAEIFSRYAEFKELVKPMEDNILKRKLYD